MGSQRHFDNDWLDDPEFKDWLRKVPGDSTKVKCYICPKTIRLSTEGKSAVQSHGKCKKHGELLEKRLKFFQPSSTTNPPETSVIKKVNKTEIHVRWLLKSVMSGYSYRSIEDFGDMMPAMFPDSELAKNTQIKRTKAGYLVTHGIAVHFKNILLDEVKNSQIHVLSFDESLNDVTQKCEMDVLIRFWDKAENVVKTRYFASTFFGHGTAEDLIKNFAGAVGELDKNKLYQISMDGPRVNFKFLRLVRQERQSGLFHNILDIGSCNLHSISGGFKTGAESSNWDLHEVLKGAFHLLHDTPARREDYETITKCKKYPLYFCSTRWVENVCVAERLIEIWQHIKKLFQYWAGKKCVPTSKSAVNVKGATADPLMVAKLSFFKFVASKAQPFLKAYQTDDPMVPFMYHDLKKLVKSLLELCVKPEILAKCKTAKNMQEINLDENKNLCEPKNLVLGFAVETIIKDLKRKDLITISALNSFREGARSFVVRMLKKIFERSSLTSDIVRGASVLDPFVISSVKKPRAENLFKILLTELIDHKILSPSCCDTTMAQFTEFLENECKNQNDNFKNLSRQDDQLDHFYFHVVQIQKYEELAFVVKLVLTLSHGQAAAERCFSVGNNCNITNMEPENIVGRKIVKDHMLANKLEAHSIVIDKPFLLQVKDAHLRYDDHCQKKKEEQENLQNDAQRARREAKEAKEELLRQAERDLKILMAGINVAEESIETGNKEIEALLTKKTVNKDKLMASQAKMSMGLKRKAELSSEIEQVKEKKKKLSEDK